MKRKINKYPCEDAFLTNPVVSPTDRTGYAVVVPQTDAEADSLSELFEGIPVRSHKEFTTHDDEYHCEDKSNDQASYK